MMKMRTFEMTRGCVTVNFAVGGDTILLNGRQVTADTMNAEYRKLRKLGFHVVKPEATPIEAPKEPEKRPKHWLFPKVVDGKIVYASEHFDRFKYEEKAKDMGCWAPVKKIVPGRASREAVYRALGAIESPEWIEWANKKLGR